MTDILGATTSDLAELASQLSTTTADIAGVSSSTEATSRAVVDEMTAAFGRAVGEIQHAMGDLRATVDRARGRLADTTWTGQNRVAFDGAYDGFNGAMGNLEQAIGDAYGQFNQQMLDIGAVMTDFQAQVATGLQQAQDSTASMAEAVQAQQANLEAVMNTGLSVA